MSNRYRLPSRQYSSDLPSSAHVALSAPDFTEVGISRLRRSYCSYPGSVFKRSWPNTAALQKSAKAARLMDFRIPITITVELSRCGVRLALNLTRRRDFPMKALTGTVICATALLVGGMVPATARIAAA